jgi:hypothetical protein
MDPYFYQSSYYEYPLVMTKEILLIVFDNELKENSNNSNYDLGANIPIYDWHLYKSHIIESKNVLQITENVLYNFANAFKYLDDEILYYIVEQEANKLRKHSLGSVIDSEGYLYIIRQAIINKDTRLVAPNKTIRFLKNPYYKKVNNEYRREINQTLNSEIVEKNYKSICTAISDYDLNQRLTKNILKCITNLSLASIKNYLNKHKELNEMFEAVKANSGTKKQVKTKLYNLAKISKMAIYPKKQN